MGFVTCIGIERLPKRVMFEEGGKGERVTQEDKSKAVWIVSFVV